MADKYPGVYQKVPSALVLQVYLCCFAGFLSNMQSLWFLRERSQPINNPRYFTKSLQSSWTFLFLSLSNMLILGWNVSFFWKGRKITKFDIFGLSVNLFEVSQTYSLYSPVLRTCSNDWRFLSAYKIFVSSAKR